MSLTQSAYDVYTDRLAKALNAYRVGALGYDGYIGSIEYLHDLMVDDYYKGAEELENLIYQTEEIINGGLH